MHFLATLVLIYLYTYAYMCIVSTNVLSVYIWASIFGCVCVGASVCNHAHTHRHLHMPTHFNKDKFKREDKCANTPNFSLLSLARVSTHIACE